VSAVRDTLKVPDSGRSWTFEDLLELSDDGFRYEIIDGSLLVTPPPGVGHQRIVTELVVALSTAAPPKLLVLAGAGVAKMQGETTYFEPDVVVVDRDAAPDGDNKLNPQFVRLVIEVVSPSSERIDNVLKRDAYARMGLPHYWIVTPQDRLTAYDLRAGSYARSAEMTGADSSVEIDRPFPMVIHRPLLFPG
jgi:Uma2 family endonuclease